MIGSLTSFIYLADSKKNTVHSMQKQKDNIRQEILKIARQEFFTHGFKNASMRTIAQKAQVGLSNIYNYFKNKDEILQEVLKPLVETLNQITAEHNKPHHISINTFDKDQHWDKHINAYVNLIYKYRNELDLLLFKSHGSSFENYKDEYINQHTQTGIEYLTKMKEKYPWINDQVSKFFIHTISSWWMSIISEIVSHELSRDEIKIFFSEYAEFATAGWKKIMRV